MLTGSFLGPLLQGILMILLGLLGLLFFTMMMAFVVRVCFRAVYSEKRRHLQILNADAGLEADFKDPVDDKNKKEI